ncbi:unnamed protein product [Acanthoscelides obtectus]|uniref:Uncharacterized protein n=1 Tax=Acanthoscelides obtectus TaxID=200917 RepID=A0A9P0KI29_ACAOB|nr:unnamed protein product [Acanthoscelides obtectus]CAK1625618.1 hypothetical protein AOBTE_LOCUS3277 [Acanthoscelides obtectus]
MESAKDMKNNRTRSSATTNSQLTQKTLYFRDLECVSCYYLNCLLANDCQQ